MNLNPNKNDQPVFDAASPVSPAIAVVATLPGPSATDTVSGDLSCLQCGYNLRTLSHTGCCPECGRPVWDSVTRGDLRYAPTMYLARLASAASVLLSCCIVGMLAMVGSALLVAVAIANSATESTLSAIPAVVVLLLALAAVAVWTLTTPDPRRPSHQASSKSRVAMRWALLGTLFGLPAAIVAAAFDSWVLALAAACVSLGSLLALPSRAARFMASLHGAFGRSVVSAPGRAAAMSYVLGYMIALLLAAAFFSRVYMIPAALLAMLGLHAWRLAFRPLVADLWTAVAAAQRRDAAPAAMSSL